MIKMLTCKLRGWNGVIWNLVCVVIWPDIYITTPDGNDNTTRLKVMS